MIHSSRPSITGVVLAGGRGQRMGNADKGLQMLHGRPLIAWVLEKMSPQVDELLINANRNREIYESFHHRVVADRVEGYAGPLAGLHSALSEARHDLVACAPCDTPFLPSDFVSRLLAGLADNSIDIAIAKAGAQVHPVVCLTRKRVLAHLSRFLEQGGRKFEAWYSTLRPVEVSFDDCPEAFRNINTLEDLQQQARGQK